VYGGKDFAKCASTHSIHHHTDLGLHVLHGYLAKNCFARLCNNLIARLGRGAAVLVSHSTGVSKNVWVFNISLNKVKWLRLCKKPN